MDKKIQKNQNQTKEYAINFRNKEMKYDQRFGSKSDNNVDCSKNSQTVVNLSLVLNLLERLKKKEQDFDETYLCVKNSSFFSRLESKDPHYNKEILSLNRIKEDNQKILKERIVYLQGKLGITTTIAEKDLISQHESDTNKIDKFIFQTKINQLKFRLEKAENQLRQANQVIGHLQQQKIADQQKYQLRSNCQQETIADLQKSVNQQKILNSRIKIEISQNSLKYEGIIMKLEEVLGRQQKQLDELRKYNFSKYEIPFSKIIEEKQHRLCIDSGVYYQQYLFTSTSKNLIQFSVKLNLEQQKVNSLEQSNSALRKQLIKLHSYIQEQDQKYQQNVKNLQQKIKRMANNRFLQNSRTKMSKGRNICFTSREHLNSTRYLYLQQQKLSLSDFKRNFDLNLSDVRLNTDQDQKATVSSTFYGSK